MHRLLYFSLFLISFTPACAQFGNILQRVNDAAVNRANNKINQGINKGLDKVEDGVKNSTKKPATTSTQSNPSSTDQTTNTANTMAPASVAAQPVSLRAYANYDFVPGDKIIFEDDFHTDQDGEFAEHWDLLKGQAILNKVGDGLAMKITDGNYAVIKPLMKAKNYLSREFTIEYDYYQTPNAYKLTCWLNDANDQEVMSFSASRSGAAIKFQTNGETRELDGAMPAELADERFDNRWHHIAFIQKGRTLKLYVDQFRVAMAPNNTATPMSILFGGIGDQTNPMIFKNVRIAEGGGATVIGQKFSEGKYVSHGIYFDYGQATLKPESMGELNAINQFLNENKGSRFEIGGYTDADGSETSNLALSQKRADAVKTQLVSMGVDAVRLTTKGYGEAKPISDNTTFEGKAQNRRVEFTKF